MLRAVIAIASASMLACATSAAAFQAWAGPPAGESLYSFLSGFCHQYPSRSFWLWGRPLGLCVRCIGGYAGVLIAAVSWARMSGRNSRLLGVVASTLFAVGIADGVAQIVSPYESSAVTRFATGTLGGSGFCLGFLLLSRKVNDMFQTLLRLIASATLAVVVGSSAYGEGSERVVRLANGTVVGVKTQEELSSGKLKAGQEVLLMTSTPVVVDGATVIAAGAPVVAFVQDAKEAQMAGLAGGLSLALRNTTAVDGTVIPLSGQFLSKGEDQVGRNVAVGVILCPLVLLDKGGQASIPAGAETRAMTIGDFRIKVREEDFSGWLQRMRDLLAGR